MCDRIDIWCMLFVTIFLGLALIPNYTMRQKNILKFWLACGTIIECFGVYHIIMEYFQKSNKFGLVILTYSLLIIADALVISYLIGTKKRLKSKPRLRRSNVRFEVNFENVEIDEDIDFEKVEPENIYIFEVDDENIW